MQKQPEESPTPYAAMITKQMGLMDFRKSAEELERLVRGLNPWPSAYTFLNGKTLKVWKCKVSTEKQMLFREQSSWQIKRGSIQHVEKEC